MRTIVILLVVTAVMVGCSDDDGASEGSDSASEGTPESASTSTSDAASECVTVHANVLGSLGIDSAGAAGPAGETGTGRPAYFVATADGAVWLTQEHPSSGSLGLTVPLNDEARAASEVGVDVAPDGLVFGDITAESAGAVQALACAQG